MINLTNFETISLALAFSIGMSSCYDWLARNWVQNPRQIGFVLANAVFSLKTVTFDDAS